MTREPGNEPSEDKSSPAESPAGASEPSESTEDTGGPVEAEADEAEADEAEADEPEPDAEDSPTDDVRGDGSAAGGLVGLIRARGPQKAVFVLAGLVAALIVVVGWFVVTGGASDSDDEVTVGDGAPDPTEPPEPTTTVPETTTTTLSAEEEAELEVVEAYEASLEAIDDASAAPTPDPEHPALEETHTGFGLDAVAVDVEVLAIGGTATRYPEDSERDVDVQSVEFVEQGETAVAYLEVCEVTDREEIFVESGDVITPSGELRTLQRAVEMHQVDGVWKVADLEPQDRQEGMAGCALED